MNETYSTKKKIKYCYLKLKFNWESYILSSNPSRRSFNVWKSHERWLSLHCVQWNWIERNFHGLNTWELYPLGCAGCKWQKPNSSWHTQIVDVLLHIVKNVRDRADFHMPMSRGPMVSWRASCVLHLAVLLSYVWASFSDKLFPRGSKASKQQFSPPLSLRWTIPTKGRCVASLPVASARGSWRTLEGLGSCPLSLLGGSINPSRGTWMVLPEERWALPSKKPGRGKYAWSITKAPVTTSLAESWLISQTSNTRGKREILAAANARITRGRARIRDIMGDWQLRLSK